MKLYSVVIFILLCKESKRKLEEVETSPVYSLKFKKKYDSTHEQSIDIVLDHLQSSSTEISQSHSKLSLYEECELEEFIFDCSNNISVYEESITPDQLDLLVNEKLKDLEVDSCNFHSVEYQCHNEKDKNRDLSKNDNLGRACLNAKECLNGNCLICLKKYTLKTFIENFIKINIPNSYADNHRRSVYNIEKACEIYGKHKLDINSYDLLLDCLLFKKLLKKLKKIISTFGKSLNFDKDSCERFLKKFNLKIYTRQNSEEIRWELDKLPLNQKILFYYAELMKLYKYVVFIPEILHLGGLFSEASFRNTVFIMRLLNIFAENVENVQDNKDFIIFMICRIFKCHYGYRYDIFRLPIYELECDKDNHNLNFFLWDLSVNKKHDIKRRKNVSSSYDYCDKVYFKTILYIFLYQHSIFAQYYNKSSQEIQSFQDYINKVVKSEECVACLFNEYLSRLKEDIIQIK